MGLYQRGVRTILPKTSRDLKAPRIVQSFWNLIGPSAGTLLLRHLSNFGAIQSFWLPVSRRIHEIWGKTSCSLVTRSRGRYHWSFLDMFMITSSNGNIFRVTGPFWGQSTGHRGFPSQRPVARSFDVFIALRLNKRLSKQSRWRWFETPSHSLWRHCDVVACSRLLHNSGRCRLTVNWGMGHSPQYVIVWSKYRLGKPLPTVDSG